MDHNIDLPITKIKKYNPGKQARKRRKTLAKLRAQAEGRVFIENLFQKLQAQKHEKKALELRRGVSPVRQPLFVRIKELCNIDCNPDPTPKPREFPKVISIVNIPHNPCLSCKKRGNVGRSYIKNCRECLIINGLCQITID